MEAFAIGIMSVLLGWKFGDWKNFRKYYPTILYFIIGDLLYNIFTYNNRVWSYDEGWIFPNHPLVNLWIMVTVYPATVIIYLFHFPKSNIKRILYIVFWVILYFIMEIFAVQIFGFIDHLNGWNLWWSFLFDIIIFVMLALHYKFPLIAWGLSILIIIFFLTVFDIHVHKLN